MPKRRLPREFGRVPLLVSADAALSYWRHDLAKADPFLLSMARELVRPKMSVWDIGANVGLFSFVAAALGASVVAVEADLLAGQSDPSLDFDQPSSGNRSPGGRL